MRLIDNASDKLSEKGRPLLGGGTNKWNRNYCHYLIANVQFD